MVTNVMIVGVGGQGSLLASKLLGNVVLKKGFDVKVSEVHGMSQRGGSVVTYVRWGDRVSSPIIDKGEADYIISFELLEAARYIDYLKKGGTVIVNSQKLDPMPVLTGAAEYPSGLEDKMREAGANVDEMDALGIAMQAGSAKSANIALMGRFSNYYKDISEDEWLSSLADCVKPQFLELNKKAFALGRSN
ncbi:MAG: indolepyruvate oxidoreductase subunit beta [Treponema sp.]|nr:indolepyruvate oxidoreductase subunit beta [Treponema sp.]